MRALVISNLHAPDCIGGYEMVASECMDALERNHGWDIRCYCAQSGRPQTAPYPPRVRPILTGYFPRGWAHHHALRPAARHLKNTPDIVATLEKETREADVTLLFNPRRLSTIQWLPALAASKKVVAWVSDYWPAEYPDCDKLWQASIENKWNVSPFVMQGAANVREIYGSSKPAANDLRYIHRAAFVSEFIRGKNVQAFPHLGKSAVIHNGINLSLFPFTPMTAERWQTWGFCGRIQKDKGVREALMLFAQAATAKPSLRFLIAGDMSTTHGKEIQAEIRKHPLLSQRVEILGAVRREQLATRFFHRIGVLLFTSQWNEPFALTVIEAMSCGTYVVATPTGGTPEIVNPETGTLLPMQSVGSSPSAPELILPEEPRSEILEQIARAKTAASEKTIDRMAENIHRLAQ